MCKKNIIKTVTGSTRKLEKCQNHGCLHNLNSVHMCSVYAPLLFQWHQHILFLTSPLPLSAQKRWWQFVELLFNILFALCAVCKLRHFSCTAKTYRQDFRMLPWWISLWVFCMLVTLLAVWTNEQASPELLGTVQRIPSIPIFYTGN